MRNIYFDQDEMTLMAIFSAKTNSIMFEIIFITVVIILPILQSFMKIFAQNVLKLLFPFMSSIYCHSIIKEQNTFFNIKILYSVKINEIRFMR